MNISNTEANVRSEMLLALVESGEYDRLKALLRNRLNEAGWVDRMRILCRQQLREHYQQYQHQQQQQHQQGQQPMVHVASSVPTLDDLVNTVTPTAQATVPEPIKAEMLKEIKSALLSKIPESVLVV